MCIMSRSELALARALLDGYVEEDNRGRLRTKRLKKGSLEETDARRELAEHLRGNGPKDRGILRSLAALYDPAKAGNPGSCPIRNTQIAAHVYAEMQRSKRYEDVIASAADKFCLSESTIEKIYGRYRAYGSLLLVGNEPLPSSQRT
jgi:hypothetical protein